MINIHNDRGTIFIRSHSGNRSAHPKAPIDSALPSISQIRKEHATDTTPRRRRRSGDCRFAQIHTFFNVNSSRTSLRDEALLQRWPARIRRSFFASPAHRMQASKFANSSTCSTSLASSPSSGVPTPTFPQRGLRLSLQTGALRQDAGGALQYSVAEVYLRCRNRSQHICMGSNIACTASNLSVASRSQQDWIISANIPVRPVTPRSCHRPTYLGALQDIQRSRPRYDRLAQSSNITRASPREAVLSGASPLAYLTRKFVDHRRPSTARSASSCSRYKQPRIRSSNSAYQALRYKQPPFRRSWPRLRPLQWYRRHPAPYSAPLQDTVRRPAHQLMSRRSRLSATC